MTRYEITQSDLRNTEITEVGDGEQTTVTRSLLACPTCSKAINRASLGDPLSDYMAPSESVRATCPVCGEGDWMTQQRMQGWLIMRRMPSSALIFLAENEATWDLAQPIDRIGYLQDLLDRAQR